MQFLIPKDPKLAWTMLYSQLQVRQDISCCRQGYGVFFSGRQANAIYHGLKALQIAPGYHFGAIGHLCSAVEPISAMELQYGFYDIERDGAPNFDDLHAKIDPHTRAILAVHYFGFPQPMRA